MGREILFRGKRKDNGEWIEGGYAEHDGKVFIVTWVRYMPDTRDWDTVEYYENNPHYNSSLSEVFPETVCQYAGFSDCNKAKVFEGDILKGKGKLYIVEFDSSCGAFTIRSNAKGSLRCFFGKTESQYMETVGNMYDNPELLNQ